MEPLTLATKSVTLHSLIGLSVDGCGGVVIGDPRFVEDDPRSLAEVGLLRPGRT